jgi:hypothetical protein
LSSKSGYFFKLKFGNSVDTGPASLEQMILDGVADDTWIAHKNWKNINDGDRIWIYYGKIDGDLGIVALAYAENIEKPNRPNGTARIKLAFDLTESKKLLKMPFSALMVRRFITRPQGALYKVEKVLANKLSRHLDLKFNKPQKTKFATRGYALGVSSTISYTYPLRKVTVRRRHDEIIRPLKTRLESEGWQAVQVDVKPMRVDLAMKRKNYTIIVEAKTISGSSSGEVRAAFAQLKEYGWRVERSKRNATNLILWALFEKEPKSGEIEFLEDQDIYVSWISQGKKRLIHGDHTSRKELIRSLG